MRKNKKYYGLIAGVMALALATPFIGYNVAKADKLYDDVVAWYDFNDGTITNTVGDTKAVLLGKGLSSYSGKAVFDNNRDSEVEGKSLRLDGKYGLELNTKDIGDNYSVSLWMKSEKKVPKNTPVLFVGYHNPELWYSVSGNDDNDRLKFWYNHADDENFNWVTKIFAQYEPTDWHQIVLTGDGKKNTAYFDGKKLSSNEFLKTMSGENQDIYIGVNNWDDCYKGLIDDVMVYNRTISDSEVERLFKEKAPEKTKEPEDKTDYEKDHLVATYDFEDGIGDAKAIKKGLGKYDGEIAFVDGVYGKALATNGYGLDLGNKIKGTDFTINFYAKPNQTQAENQVMFLMGYHDPELWTALSGDGGDQSYKLWGNTNSAAKTTGNAAAMSWTTVGSPIVQNDVWSMITVVGTDGEIKLYVNGELSAKGAYNNPLCGEKASILLGANFWDSCFDGAFDDVKVYDTAMSASAIEKAAKEFTEVRLQKSLASACSFDAIKGENTEAEHIRYNLQLPTSVIGAAVNWTSSNPSVISDKGVVTFSEKAEKVKLTAEATLAGKKAKTEVEVTVDAIDKTELNALVETAKSYDLSIVTENSAARLTEAIKNAEAAATFAEIDDATIRVSKAIEGLEFTDDFVDPFDLIPEAQVACNLNVKKTATLFTLPKAVLDKVNVEYVTENDKVATYADGVVTAVKAGKTIVTARVKALSDDYVMEYSTAVSVKAQSAGGAPAGGSSSSKTPASRPSTGATASAGTGAAAGTTTINPAQVPLAGAEAAIKAASGSAGKAKTSTKKSANASETTTETEDVNVETEDETEVEIAEEPTPKAGDNTDVVEDSENQTIAEEEAPTAGESTEAGINAGTVAGIIAIAVVLLGLLVYALGKFGILKFK